MTTRAHAARGATVRREDAARSAIEPPLAALQHAAGNRAVGELLQGLRGGSRSTVRDHRSAQRQPAPGGPPSQAGSGSGPTPGGAPTTSAPAAGAQPGTATPALGTPAPATQPTPADPNAPPTAENLAKIQQFDPLVRGHALFAGAAAQTEFFLAERPFFGTDERTAAHFARIRKANIPGSQTLLHDDAATRLEAIAAELGTNMPQSGGVGWPRVSSFDRRNPQTIADPHTIGLAIDYDATEMPHLGNRGERVDMRSLDLILLVTGHQGWMDLGEGADAVFRAIDAATTKGEAERQKILARADVSDMVLKVLSESQVLTAVSQQVRESLDRGQLGANRTRLIELRTRMAGAKNAAERQQVMNELPTVLASWIQVVDAEKTKVEGALRLLGFDPAALPSAAELARRAAAINRILVQLAALARQVAAFKRQLANPRLSAAARTRIEGQVTTLGAQARTLAAGLPAPPVPAPGVAAPVPATTGPATTGSATTPPAPTVVETVAAEIDASKAAASVAKERFTKAGKTSVWLDRVVSLRRGLTEDPEFVFGRFSRGKAVQEVALPSLAQIADTGFYSTKGVSMRPEAFGEDFVLAAVQRGFTPGAEWQHPDSMHFELRRPGGG